MHFDTVNGRNESVKGKCFVEFLRLPANLASESLKVKMQGKERENNFALESEGLVAIADEGFI